MIRFVLRRLAVGDPHAAPRDVPGVLRDPHRHRPGCVVSRVPTHGSTAKKIAEYREINGLYEGFGGYVRGYFQWLQGFVTGDWPKSIYRNGEVWPVLKDALANSLVLGITASTVGIIIGIALGVFAALRPGRLRDTVGQHRRARRSVHPAVRLGHVLAAAVRHLLAALVRRRLAVPDQRRVPARAHRASTSVCASSTWCCRSPSWRSRRSPCTRATCAPRCST